MTSLVEQVEKSPSVESTKPVCDPIFILGIMPRSGTNFLYNLMSLHPQCYGVGIRDMPEDHLLANANLLVRFANNSASFWSRHGRRGVGEPERQKLNRDLQDKLVQSLGDGLITYLTSLNPCIEKPLLTKTPSVRNLPYFFKLFPNARLIILVRDGRAVVESNIKSFGADFEVSLQSWTEAAQTIIDFDQAYRGSEFQYQIVRYEDIVDNLKGELSRLCEFLGLDVSAYNFEAAASLPIFGSSEDFSKVRNSVVTDDPSGVGWKVVEKKPDFKPKSRWSQWNQAQHDRFNWVAGQPMTHFGYSLERVETGRSLLSSLNNQVADARWRVVMQGMSAAEKLERTLYALLRLRRDFKRLRME